MTRKETTAKVEPPPVELGVAAHVLESLKEPKEPKPAKPTEHEKLALTVHLAEYAALRKEIELRLGWQTIALSVSLPFFAGILVAAMSAMSKDKNNGQLWAEQYPIVLAAATVGASILGLLVCNQDLMVFRLGSYIRDELARDVKEIVKADVFNWERYHPSQEKGVPKLLSFTVHALLFVAAAIPLAAFVACYVSVGTKLGAYDYHKPNISHWVFIGFALLTFIMFSLALFGSYRVAKDWRKKAKESIG
ncbi:MAG TPA: hypothetical protein VHE55_06050 [Fimbriimonadaceae bacterium]|nr:hypothetical protein [Fimbriimonadaceae bacterium]